MRRSTPLLLALMTASTLSWEAQAATVPTNPPLPALAETRLPHISIVSLGEGSPVVLLPGLSSPRAVWDNLAPALSQKHKVILVQVNGFAGDAPGANLQAGVLDGIVADLHSYLEREKIGKVRFIGHSMGALAGIIFASAHPDQVDRLMLVDGLPFFPVLMARDGFVPTVASMTPIAQKMRGQIASSYGKPADPVAVEANVKGLAVKPASLERMKSWAKAADARVNAEVFYEDLTTDARSRLGSITAPVTVVMPWNEKGFEKAKVTAFYHRQYGVLPHVSYVDIADAGHFVMLDQPERFAEAVSSFLQ